MSLIESDVFKIIQKDLKEYNGKINFLKGRYCGGESKCSGLFYTDCQDQPVIKVAKGSLKEEEWFGVLIHEYCHFLQWRDEVTVWNKFCNYTADYSDIVIRPKKYKKELLALIDLELDCEKRCYKIIKINKLFDHEVYAKSANAVLYKYAFLFQKGYWPDDNRKYKKAFNLSPVKLLKSPKDYFNIPKGIVEVYTTR